MDHYTKQRQKILSTWQRRSLSSMFGDAPTEAETKGAFWRAIETVVTFVGLFGMGLAALWVIGVALGFYGRMFYSGWEFGWRSLAWLMEFGR